MNDFRKLRAASRARLREVRFPNPFDLDEFCRLLAEQRGRPIHLAPWKEGAVPSTVSGAWLRTPNADYIGYQPHLTGYFLWLVVFHELGHCMCEDLDQDHVEHPDGERLFQHIAPETTEYILMRHGRYDQRAEAMAEMLGSLMIEQAMLNMPTSPDNLVSRMAASLSHTPAT